MGTISNRLWGKAGMQRIPLAGTFELLPVCNLHCKMCYVRKSMEEVNAQGGLLPKEQWLDWARQARDGGLLFPLITGGEPFLRQDLPEILSGMQAMGLQVSINTNATLIDQPMARWLGKHRPTRVNITLYGDKAESYEALCGNGGAYDQVRQAVDSLKQNQVPVKFSASITPENLGDLEGMIRYAKSVNSPIQIATYMFPPTRRDACMVGQNHRLSPDQAAWARVQADWLQNEPDWFRGQAARYSRFVPVTDRMLAEQRRGEPHEMTCRAGRCSFWLDWQGNLGNCGMYSTARFSLADTPFAEAWQKVVEDTNQVRYSAVCTNCPNFSLCHPCIAMVHNECGQVQGRPEYLCRMTAAAARYYQAYAEKLGPAEGKPQSPPPARDCEFETDGF